MRLGRYRNLYWHWHWHCYRPTCFDLLTYFTLAFKFVLARIQRQKARNETESSYWTATDTRRWDSWRAWLGCRLSWTRCTGSVRSLPAGRRWWPAPDRTGQQASKIGRWAVVPVESRWLAVSDYDQQHVYRPSCRSRHCIMSSPFNKHTLSIFHQQVCTESWKVPLYFYRTQ